MINYADYNFYTNDYKGSLSADLFNHFIIKASRYIDNKVNREITSELIASLSEKDQFRLKYTACQLCDFIKNNGDATSGTAKSISIDGVSITGGDGDISTVKAKEKEIIENLPHELTRDL